MRWASPYLRAFHLSQLSAAPASVLPSLIMIRLARNVIQNTKYNRIPWRVSKKQEDLEELASHSAPLPSYLSLRLICPSPWWCCGLAGPFFGSQVILRGGEYFTQSPDRLV